MPHIRYGGANYSFPQSELENVKTKLHETFSKGGWSTLTFQDSDGDLSTIYITQGTPIAIHEWESSI
jgi:hypothetical protein